MQLSSAGKKLHTRKVEVTTYEYDEQRVIVEGSLKDDRFQDSHLVTGEKFPGGVVHHMIVRLVVNYANFLIEDVEVDLLNVPREICQETKESLAPLKGLHITKGFTAKAKKLIGGSGGCTHLVELIQAMAPAAFQGYAAFQSRKAAAFTSDQAKRIIESLINTCHAWREDVSFVKRIKERLELK